MSTSPPPRFPLCDVGHPMRPGGCRVCALVRTARLARTVEAQDPPPFTPIDEDGNTWSAWIDGSEIGTHLTTEQMRAIETHRRRAVSRGLMFEAEPMTSYWASMDERRARGPAGDVARTIARICPPGRRWPSQIIAWQAAFFTKMAAEHGLALLGVDLAAGGTSFSVVTNNRRSTGRFGGFAV